MAYSAILAGEVDQDSPITVGLMTKIKDNFDALKDGSAFSGVIAQGGLKTTTGEVSYSYFANSGTGDTIILTMPGGEYGFAEQIKYADAGDHKLSLSVYSDGTTYKRLLFDTLAAAAGSPREGTVYAKQRHIQASPPYSINGIDYPIFIFLKLKAGKIISTYSAEDPPWAHNGPTNITPDFYKDGIGYKRKLIIPDNVLSIKDKCKKTYCEELGKIKPSLIKVCTDFKNSDMKLIPHPFLSNSDGEEIILACPQDKIMADVLTLLKTGESIAELIHDGVLELSSDVEDVGELFGGVVSRKLKWKNTGN